jgi:hypothetical protein
VLNDVEIPTRGNATLDFVFSSVPGATGGLNEMQSGSDHGVMWARTALLGRKSFRTRMKVNVKKCKEQWTQEGESLAEWTENLAEVV